MSTEQIIGASPLTLSFSAVSAVTLQVPGKSQVNVGPITVQSAVAPLVVGASKIELE